MSHIHILKSKHFVGEWISRYSDFVLHHPDSNIYHTLAWHQVIQGTYGFSPIYLVYEKGDEIKGVLTLFEVRSIAGHRMVSIPYSHWVPILCSDEHSLYSIISSAEHFSREHNCRFIMLRTGSRLPSSLGWTAFEKNFHTLLSLNSSLPVIWSNIEGSARRAVKRAKSNGLRVETPETDQAYNTFYKLMLDTRRRQAVPVYPPKFFDYIRRHLVPLRMASLMMAYKDDEALGGIIVFRSGKSAVYGYGASLNDKEKMRSRPMDLLMWHAIEDSHSNHAEFFDFGTTPYFHLSLLRFKEKWGAKSKLLPYCCRLRSGTDYTPAKREGVLTRTAGVFLSKLPDKLYINASAIILKQLG